jgi:hypothetical protein
MMNPRLDAVVERDVVMQRNVQRRAEFEDHGMQVKAFWSNVHEGFYVVTGFGFPCIIYVKHLDRWFGAENSHMSAIQQRRLTPNAEIEVVSPEVLTDIYRRGMAGLAKHRILGQVKG